MPQKVRGGVQAKRKSYAAKKGPSKPGSIGPDPEGCTDPIESTDTINHVIEESDAPFTSIPNMLPGDHPHYHNMNKIFEEFSLLSEAVNDMKFNSFYDHTCMVTVQAHLSRMNDIAKDMILTHRCD
jgi:hypothetical protein